MKKTTVQDLSDSAVKKTTVQDLSDLVVSVCRRVWIARRENDNKI